MRADVKRIPLHLRGLHAIDNSILPHRSTVLRLEVESPLLVIPKLLFSNYLIPSLTIIIRDLPIV